MAVNDLAAKLRAWPVKQVRAIRRLWPRARFLWSLFRGSIFWKLLAQQRDWLFALAGLSLLVTTATFATVQTLRKMIDQAIVDQVAPLSPFVHKLVGLAVVMFAVGLAHRQVVSRIGFEIEYQLRVILYRQLQAAGANRLNGLSSGQLVTRTMSDLEIVKAVATILPSIALLPFMLAGMAIYLLVVAPPVAVLALAAVFINLFMITRLYRRMVGLTWLELNTRAEVTAAVDEPVRGIRVVKAFAREADEEARLARAARLAYRVGMTRVRVLANWDVVMKAAPVVLHAAVLSASLWLIASSHLSIGTLTVIVGLSSLFTTAAGALSDVTYGFGAARAGTSRFGEILNLAAVPGGGALLPAAGGRESGAPEGKLVAAGLGLTRSRSGGLDLDLAGGQVAAVSGGSQSSRSRLVAVLAGRRPPGTARVELDGVPVNQLSRSCLLRTVRVVEEEPFLFGRSVLGNLQFGAQTGLAEARVPDQTTIGAALWAAAAEGIVEALPDGLATVLGDRGLTLSGGQRQRLALARALVEPPRLLILHDALSAVPPAVEADILERIRHYSPLTIIVSVSRRPSAVRADVRLDLSPDPAESAPSIDEPVPAPPPPSWVGLLTDAGISLTGLTSAKVGDRPLDSRLANLVAAQDLRPYEPEVSEAVAVDDSRPPSVLAVLRPLLGRVLQAAGALVVLTGALLAPALLLAGFVDAANNHQSGQALWKVLWILVVGVAAAPVAWAFRMAAARVAQGIFYLLRRRVFRRLSRLGTDFYDRELPGLIATRVVHDIDTITAFAEGSLNQIVAGGALLVGTTAVLYAWSPSVATQLMLFLPPMLAVMVGQFVIGRRIFFRVRRALGRVIARLEEDFAGRELIASFGAEAQASHEFDLEARDLRRVTMWSTVVINTGGQLFALLAALASAAVFDRSGYLTLIGVLSVGAVVGMHRFIQAAIEPIGLLGRVLEEWIPAQVSLRTLGEPFRAPILPQRQTGAVPAPALDGPIAIEGATFRYPGTATVVLHEVDLSIAPGEVVALVGPTGAGKSSVAKLLTRMYDPEEGRVTYGGRDIRTLDLDSYRRRLGIVPQDAFCFRGTVASNVAYGRPDATGEEIETAVRAVGAHDLLTSRPGGLAARVEEEGRNLGTTERQLIALARAWLMRPEFLLLDEATSGLDSDVEATVLAAVRSLGVGALFISHRRSVAEWADRVIVMEQGRIAGAGSPGQLATDRTPAYAELWGPEPLAPARRRNTGRRRSSEAGR